MIINAEDLILGRLATYVAKKALLGNKIDIVNAEKIVIIGKKENILEKYEARRKRGDPLKGPFFPRHPEKLVKRTIRSMLPYKQERGKNALKNIKCYIGIPQSLKDEKIETLNNAKIKEHNIRFMYIKDLSKHLGY